MAPKKGGEDSKGKDTAKNKTPKSEKDNKDKTPKSEKDTKDKTPKNEKDKTPKSEKNKDKTPKSEKDNKDKTPKSGKDKKGKGLTPASDMTSSYFAETEEIETPRNINFKIELKGKPAENWRLFVLFDGRTLIESIWEHELILETEDSLVNLKDPYCQSLIADTPLIFVVRCVPGGKGAKEPDPLTHPDNRAGGNVDLSPLVLGQEEVLIKVPMISTQTKEPTGCKIKLKARAQGTSEFYPTPVMLSLLSAHCLPPTKDGTGYIGAIGMTEVLDPAAVNFGLSLSNKDATKLAWASASTGGILSDTAYSVPNEDKYIPPDCDPKDTDDCISVYWNVTKRVLTDPSLFQKRLSNYILLEIAGVPKTGKVDVRGRYMAYIDARVLLEPVQFGVTICARLQYYAEAFLPQGMEPLLELPPASAKTAVPITQGPTTLFDEHGHGAYVVVRIDLVDPLVMKPKIDNLFEALGFPCPQGVKATDDDLVAVFPPEDNTVDVRRIRTESGALAVHKELSTLACRGLVPMNQSIKRTAANRLLTRVRTMLKQFAPENVEFLDWQDAVTRQHAAARRAVTASFRPQPPNIHAGPRAAAARSRMAGDTRIADKHIHRNLKASHNHPRVLLSKALRCLEERNDRDAKTYLLRAIDIQKRNRFLLWTFAGQEFNKGPENLQAAKAALRISLKSDYSDGTGNAIGWAALHTLLHYEYDLAAAFVAAKKMRKSYEVVQEWKSFVRRWTETSGEEEVLWKPETINDKNPMLIASAFFLCLRCYEFSERILLCFEEECATRGSRFRTVTKMCSDVYYLRAASLLLRRQIDRALELCEQCINRFGPSPIMSEMRTTILSCSRGWDGECEAAFRETERSGTTPCPKVLLDAAVGGMKTNPSVALQRAARAHQMAPGAHSALIIGRIYDRLGEDNLAVRWASAAVKFEPLLADGWVFLAMLAMRERDRNKARTLLRTAKQVGPTSPDIQEELDSLMKIYNVEALSDLLVKDSCYCRTLSCNCSL